jgi:hypothetical protein
MTKKSGKLGDNPTTQLLVYGLDEAGKAKGARFPAAETEKVLPVLTAMRLEHCQSGSDEVSSLGMKLPVGRIYARGKAFIPNIKRDLYDKLLAAVSTCKENQDRLLTEPTTANAPGPEASDGPVQQTGGKAAALPPLPSGLPQNWESIAAGNMILADAGPGEGFWQAIVIARDNEILTLRYRDFPKVKPFERHVSTVALINPTPA